MVEGNYIVRVLKDIKQNRGYEYGKGWVRVCPYRVQNRGFELCLEVEKNHTGYENCTYLEKDTCTQAILMFIVIDLQWLQWE